MLMLAVGLGLLVFGLIYAVAVEALRLLVPDHGMTSFEVVVGVGAVLLGLGIVHGERIAGDALVLFAAAGAPMVLGDIGVWAWRRHRASRATARQIQRNVSDGR